MGKRTGFPLKPAMPIDAVTLAEARRARDKWAAMVTGEAAQVVRFRG